LDQQRKDIDVTLAELDTVEERCRERLGELAAPARKRSAGG